MSRRRGFALVHVLTMSIVVGSAAIVWRASFQALHAHSARGPDRARARALAQAAWERARAALAAGRDPTTPEANLLDGRAAVSVSTVAGGLRRVVVDAVALRRDREPVRARLVVTLDPAGRVTSRVEVGG